MHVIPRWPAGRSHTRFQRLLFGLAILLLASSRADRAAGQTPADKRLSSYFTDQTTQLREDCLASVDSLQQWEARRTEYRRQLLEMLGLDPLPPRTDLKPVIVGSETHGKDDAQIVVERIHFQSRPGLYVTGNLYRPRVVGKPLPAILYVCGHGRVRIDNVDYGNKVHYQHHGAWFARNGYVCLTIDTLQLGEIEGVHHGTYSHNRWWWLNRGYTPAGVEAWNCLRALDYLQTRKEVDGQRMGVTGRSGGGAYSWWIAAIDDRIRAAVPVAGITDLQNHVVDGCVEGHCDCMYFVNTYQWDYPLVAALVAPRPLLISNTDRDSIFPLEGVVRTHRMARKIYELYGAEDKLALHITAGPHKDTQELRVHAFRWFNHFLKNDDSLVHTAAEKLFQPQQLKVFDRLPNDQRNQEIDEDFVAAFPTPSAPADKSQWKQQSGHWRKQLQTKSFRAWPEQTEAASAELTGEHFSNGLQLRKLIFISQAHVQLPLWVIHREKLESPRLVVLNVLDQEGWKEMTESLGQLFPKSGALEGEQGKIGDDADSLQKMLRQQPWAIAYTAPRGIGPDAWSGDARKQTQIRRRFYLLGQTLDGMRIWDVRRATEALRRTSRMKDVPVWLQAERKMSGVALHAAVFERYGRVDLYDLPTTYRDGPVLLNSRRYLNMPQVAALAADRSPLVLYNTDSTTWDYVTQASKALGWPKKQFQMRRIEQAHR